MNDRVERQRIVLVEDTDDLRTFMALALDLDGYEVLEASNAEDGFRLVRDMLPDLVITDIMMEGPSGLELVSRMHRELPSPIPPIIVCSGVAELEQESLRRGAMLFLLKPVSRPHLQQVVEQVLSGHWNHAVGATARSAATLERQDARIAAGAELASLANRAELRRRGSWGAHWLSAYFGFGTTILAVVENGALRIEASSDEVKHAVGTTVPEVPWVNNVVECGTPILLSLAGNMADSGGGRVGSIMGAPVTSEAGTAIGALCLFDEQQRPLDADDLALVVLLGRAVSTALAAAGEIGSNRPLLVTSDLLSEQAFGSLLELEVRRSQRLGHTVELAMVRTVGNVLPVVVSQHLQGQRRFSAWMRPNELALCVVREDPPIAANEMQGTIREVGDHVGVLGAGVVSLHGADVPSLPPAALLTAVEALAQRQAGIGRGAIERAVIRREPWTTTRS